MIPSKLDPFRFNFILTFFLISLYSHGQENEDVVYLTNGAIHHGKIISLSPSSLLLRQELDVIAIDPKLIIEIDEGRGLDKTKDIVREERPKKERAPLDRRVLVELRSGIALIYPLGLDLSVGTLTRLSDRPSCWR